ncbi:hypothetical protein ACIQVT_01875 [Streptomyces sp. NPDC100445]|uniref:hypothetical protein n=1 Tax=Streptomyces sp. NPDC100445 TaxID=3366102 RepID=UPI00380A851E
MAVIAVGNLMALVILVHELVYAGTSLLVIARAVSILHRPATGSSGAAGCGAPDRQPRPSPYRRT